MNKIKTLTTIATALMLTGCGDYIDDDHTANIYIECERHYKYTHIYKRTYSDGSSKLTATCGEKKIVTPQKDKDKE